MRKNYNTEWMSFRPTHILETFATNAMWHVHQLAAYDRPNSDYYASKVDEYDFVLGQLEVRLEERQNLINTAERYGVYLEAEWFSRCNGEWTLDGMPIAQWLEAVVL